jgi:hypothetical protein
MEARRESGALRIAFSARLPGIAIAEMKMFVSKLSWFEIPFEVFFGQNPLFLRL